MHWSYVFLALTHWCMHICCGLVPFLLCWLSSVPSCCRYGVAYEPPSTHPSAPVFCLQREWAHCGLATPAGLHHPYHPHHQQQHHHPAPATTPTPVLPGFPAGIHRVLDPISVAAIIASQAASPATCPAADARDDLDTSACSRVTSLRLRTFTYRLITTSPSAAASATPITAPPSCLYSWAAPSHRPAGTGLIITTTGTSGVPQPPCAPACTQYSRTPSSTSAAKTWSTRLRPGKCG